MNEGVWDTNISVALKENVSLLSISLNEIYFHLHKNAQISLPDLHNQHFVNYNLKLRNNTIFGRTINKTLSSIFNNTSN